MVMFLCAGCADKISALYNTKRIEGSDRTGQCPLCFGVFHGDLYEIGRKKRIEYRPRTGGGERERSRR